MRVLLFWVIAAALLTLAPTCQQSPPESEGRTQVIISDLPCQAVWEKVEQELKKLNVPVSRMDREKGVIETAPVLGEPLPGDPFKIVEEQFQLALTCREPLTTRLTGKALVRGLKADESWVEIRNPDRYWERFLGKVKIK